VWTKNVTYSYGAVTYEATTREFYQQVAGNLDVSGKPTTCTSDNINHFQNPTPVTEPPAPELTTDGGQKPGTHAVKWQYVASADPTFCQSHEWQPDHDYKTIGEKVCDPDTDNRVYEVRAAGTSATQQNKPVFVFPSEGTTPTWIDIGQYPPSGVTSATAVAVTEKTVVPLNGLTLPQVHSLSYYNLSSGVLVTSIRSPNFAFTTAPTVNNGTPVNTGGNLIVDPVITLTRYIWPFDAERKEQWKDLRPGISLSFSLASPTSNFYIGGSSEFLRYVQLEYGFALCKVPELVKNAYLSSSSTMPTTTQTFAKGGYVGVSFNILGLIQGISGAGGGGGGGGGAAKGGGGAGGGGAQ
jgi:hypothetical protein